MDEAVNHTCILAIMARQPELGQVKNRLARDIGFHKALEVYTQLYQDCLGKALSFGGERCLFLTGDKKSDFKDQWPLVKKQADGDLGERMQSAITECMKMADQVVLIGTDCPELKPAHLEAARKALNNHDLVLGPAVDGGYYLIGMKQLHHALFKEMAWGTNTVLASTLNVARQLGLKVFLLQELRDLDNLEDLKFHKELYRKSILNGDTEN